jgi:hypothetical protein
MDAGDDHRTTKSIGSGGILTGSATSAPSSKERKRTPSLQAHLATVVHPEGLETVAAGVCPKCLKRPATILWEVLSISFVEIYICLNNV